jgi:HEAT repeat protein
VLTDFVADSETESSVRLRSIWGLGSAVRPISEAVDVLDEASRDSSPGVSRKSMEVLGMVANRLDQQGSRVSVQRAVRILGNRLEASPNAGMKQSALIGLGNSGSSYALPRVAGYLKSPNPDLRSAAVMALRKMEVSRAFELTRNLMRNDLSPAVRRAAVDSMAQREGSPEARKEIDRVVLQDSNESTRRAALDAILLRDEIGEEERKILEQVADKDSSEELRRIARQELSKK